MPIERLRSAKANETFLYYSHENAVLGKHPFYKNTINFAKLQFS